MSRPLEGGTPHRLPASLVAEPTKVHPRPKTSAFSTAEPELVPDVLGRPHMPAGERAKYEARQAQAFLVPEDVLGAMEKWALKAPDERTRCGRLEAVAWWRRWVRKADGSVTQLEPMP